MFVKFIRVEVWANSRDNATCSCGSRRCGERKCKTDNMILLCDAPKVCVCVQRNLHVIRHETRPTCRACYISSNHLSSRTWQRALFDISESYLPEVFSLANVYSFRVANNNKLESHSCTAMPFTMRWQFEDIVCKYTHTHKMCMSRANTHLHMHIE